MWPESTSRGFEEFRTCQSAPETWEGSAHYPPPWRARASKWFAADLRGSNSSHRPLLERLFHRLPHSSWWLSECGRRWGASAVLPISMPPRHPLRSVAWRSERTHSPAENHSQEPLKDPSTPLLHAQETTPFNPPSLRPNDTCNLHTSSPECLEKILPIPPSQYSNHSFQFTSSTSQGCLHCSTAGLDSLKEQAAGECWCSCSNSDQGIWSTESMMEHSDHNLSSFNIYCISHPKRSCHTIFLNPTPN